MSYIATLLAFTGLFAIGLCIVFLTNQAMEAWFDIRSCKRDIERLERQIKNLQCNRQP